MGNQAPPQAKEEDQKEEERSHSQDLGRDQMSRQLQQEPRDEDPSQTGDEPLTDLNQEVGDEERSGDESFAPDAASIYSETSFSDTTLTDLEQEARGEERPETSQSGNEAQSPAKEEEQEDEEHSAFRNRNQMSTQLQQEPRDEDRSRTGIQTLTNAEQGVQGEECPETPQSGNEEKSPAKKEEQKDEEHLASRSRSQMSTQLQQKLQDEDRSQTGIQTLTDAEQGARGEECPETPQSENEKMADLRKQCLRAFQDGDKEDALRLLSKVEQPDPSLVHLSVRHGWQDVCQQLVEKYNLSPTDQIHMYRPLHLACWYGSVEVVKYLLTLPQVMPTVNEGANGGVGYSALEFACGHEHLSVIEVLVSEPSVHMLNSLLMASNKFPILSLLSRKISGITDHEFPITPYFPVFMAGNTAAGKTTLTDTMIKLTDPYRPFSHGGETVTGVKTPTTGICTSQCEGKFYLKSYDEYKPDLSADTGIEIYDLAGHEEYHSSHSAIMESLCLESPAVFVLMVDLEKKEGQLSKEIDKWSSLIEIGSINIPASVVVVGSRRDKLSSEPQLLASKCKFVQCTAEDALGKQHFAGFVALDSCNPSSENMKPFLTLLTKSITGLANPEVKKMSFFCHLLHAFLKQDAKAEAISFRRLQELVSGDDALSPFSEPAMLTSSLRTLANTGLILFLRNNDCLSSSCIVIYKALILKEINGALFATPSFKEHRQIASDTGIVPISRLYEIFPRYHEFLVAMLTSLQFCRHVEPAVLASISTNLSPEFAAHDELLYFPALVKVERPADLSITKGFGWCAYCPKQRQCLTQRCQDAILLDSAYKHCLSYPTRPVMEFPKEKFARQLRRRCTVWKNGIHWKTDEGTQAMVQVSDEKRCVSLLVSSNQECPTDSLELRSSVIDTIRSKQKELCSSVEFNEYVIFSSQLRHVPDRIPSELTVFEMKDVAKNVRDKKKFVLDTELKEKRSLVDLLHFDPYLVLPPTAVQQLFAGDKWLEPVPAGFFAGKNPLEMAAEVTMPDLHPSPQVALPTSSVPPADATDTADIPPTPRVTIMDDGRVHGFVGGEVNIHQLTVNIQAQEIPQVVQQLCDSEKSSEPVGANCFAGKNHLEMAEVTATNVPPLPQGAPSPSATSASSVPSEGHSTCKDWRPKGEDSARLDSTLLAAEHLVDVKRELGHFAQWHDLGLYLGLFPKHLEVIDNDGKGTDDKLKKVLLEWLKRNYDTDKHGLPSWSALVNAVDPIDHALALTIKEKHHLS